MGDILGACNAPLHGFAETVQRDAAGSLRVSLSSPLLFSPKNGGQGVDGLQDSTPGWMKESALAACIDGLSHTLTRPECVE